jgi:hypothetical protein
VPNPNRTDAPLGYSPGYGTQEGQNERETETYDPKAGKWTINGDPARKTLPLFPRLHLLPNGRVYYDAAGQAFNPVGQAYDEALWNIASEYNPKTKKWSDLGIPGVGNGSLTVPGFIGSTFSVMMPLKPGANGRYTSASFLVAGGVPNPPSPGGYFSIKQSALHTVDTSDPKADKLSVKQTGPLATSGAFGRWYSSGTLLPDGEVLATSGADRDEVALPGFEIPVKTAELFDPKTNKWRQVAQQHEARTYHNTANLMADGRVLIGGHAVISNGYLADRTIAPGTTSPNGPVGRDPTFEIYSPPYMYCAGKAATVTGVSKPNATGQRHLTTNLPASSIKSVVAIRNGSVTHLVNSDQRSVEMPIVGRKGNTLTVQGPKGDQKGAVMPKGPYMFFATRQVGSCTKPGTAKDVIVGMEKTPFTPKKKKAKKHKSRTRRHQSPAFTG